MGQTTPTYQALPLPDRQTLSDDKALHRTQTYLDVMRRRKTQETFETHHDCL